MKKLLYLTAALFAFASCDEILQEGDGELSSSDVVKGLKTALNIGTDSSTAILSANNGYFRDEAVKILLPQEAQYVQEKINDLGGITFFSSAADVINDELLDLVEAINHSAEDAAKDAGPIFSDAITNLSIVDGIEILNGVVPEGQGLKSNTEFDSLAATTYLKNQTYNALVAAYAPRISTALDKKLVGNSSANSLWNDIVGRWNNLMDKYESNTAAKIGVELLEAKMGNLNLHRVDTNLGEFTTQKALDGLFVKVGDQEKAIRRNPFQWASDIIQKVFGSVYEKLKEI